MIEIKHDFGESNIAIDGELPVLMAEAITVTRALYRTIYDEDKEYGDIYRHVLTSQVITGELFDISETEED